MFVVLAYDVQAKRVGKALKICRKYLCSVQESVFEGHLTEAELKRLKKELQRLVDPERDSIRIYRMESVKYVSKEEIGISAAAQRII